MEVDALILADAVSAPPDGKIYVHGGGFSRYEIPRLPAPIPLGVWIRIRVEDADIDKPHSIEVTLLGPAGVPNIPPIAVEAVPPSEGMEALAEGEERFLNLALQLPAVAVRDGLYHLQLQIDGELAREVPLPVVVTGEGDGALITREWPSPEPPPAIAKPKGKPKKRPPPPPRKRAKKPRR